MNVNSIFKIAISLNIFDLLFQVLVWHQIEKDINSS